MKRKLTLLVFCVYTIAYPALSQTTNESTLRKMSSDFAEAHQKNYEAALKMAAAKGWLVNFYGKNGKVVKLVGTDVFGNPLYHTTFNNIIAAATTRTNELWPGGSSGLNLSGSSDAIKGKLAIWDGGSPLTTHVELIGRVVVKDGATVGDHPTFTSGMMIATGVNPIAKGMAFGTQQLLSYDFDNDISEMSATASSLLISNHSYGFSAGWDFDGTDWNWFGDTTISRQSYYFGYYDQSAQQYDSIAYNAPFYLMCFSSGNVRNETGPAVGAKYKYNGGTSVTRTSINNNPDFGSVALNGTAKNVLLVGAVNGIPGGPHSASDIILADFSSAGPTDDGRIKPDVVADGVQVTSTSSASTTAYETADGTSASCPNVTGSLYLLQEYYTRLHPGNFLRAATVKALALHTAQDAGNTGPDYHFGWGLLNDLAAANVITSSFKHQTDTIVEKSLDNAANAVYTINVTASGSGKLYATIVWNDPPGLVNTTRTTLLNNTTPKLVHDLDLRIIRQSDNNTYLPWVLNPVAPNSPATKGDNIIDNEEQVVVDSAIAGQTYTIKVTHKGSLARGSQAFSLIVSGIGGQQYCTSAPTSSAGARIDEVDFGSIAKANPAGCTTYTNNTNVSTGIEAGATIPLTVKVSSCDASSSPKIVKVFIDFNSDGDFTDAGELVATSNAITATGTFSANVTIPGDVVVGNSSIMRIIVEETSTAADVVPCGSYGKGETQDYRVLFTQSGNDVSLEGIVSPQSGDCPNSSQYITVRIRNNGTAAKQNIPVTIKITKGASTVYNTTETFRGTVGPDSTADYTLQAPFNSVGGQAYTYTAIVASPGDPFKANDTLKQTITISAVPQVSGSAEVCGSNVRLKVNNANSGNTYFWYTDTTASPIATGSGTTTNVIPTNKTYFVTSGGKETLGPVNKLVYPQGGYNTFFSNFILMKANVPAIIETARLYIGHGGTIKFVLNPANSDSTFFPALGDSVTLETYATSPVTPTPGAQVNDPSDTGAIYRLNLKMDNTVSKLYILWIYCTNGATIFRNDSLKTSPYPVGSASLVTITGNSAPTPGQYYYFIYNAAVRTLNQCLSDAATVVASAAPTPVVTLVADSLVSSISSGNQWYFNNSPIAGATGSSYKPTQTGTYAVIVTDSIGCQKGSNNFAFVLTGLQNVTSSAISLRVTPNPNRGDFLVSMHLNTPANLQLDLYNTIGQNVKTEQFGTVSGSFTNSIHVPGLTAGVYIMRISDGKKAYYQKLIITK